jgi:hypothetical protein
MEKVVDRLTCAENKLTPAAEIQETYLMGARVRLYSRLAMI